MEKYTYIPGVCNIGPDEIKKRKIGGWAGLTITILFWGLSLYSLSPEYGHY
jgi:hypothetical protein